MPAVIEIDSRQSVDLSQPSAPEITPSQVDPDNFRKTIDSGRWGILRVLDEHITYVSTDGNTVAIRQYILGHHDNNPFLRMARPHKGWQGDETIREFYRLRMICGDGTVIFSTREIDLSDKRPPINSDRWGRPITV